MQVIKDLQSQGRELAAIVALARAGGDPSLLQSRLEAWVQSVSSGARLMHVRMLDHLK